MTRLRLPFAALVVPALLARLAFAANAPAVDDSVAVENLAAFAR